MDGVMSASIDHQVVHVIGQEVFMGTVQHFPLEFLGQISHLYLCPYLPRCSNRTFFM